MVGISTIWCIKSRNSDRAQNIKYVQWYERGIALLAYLLNEK